MLNIPRTHTIASQHTNYARSDVPNVQHGFTLIEVLVVIAIIGVLTMLAIPSFVGLISSTSVSRSINAFVSDTRYARGEAMRRGKSVTICRSATPLANIPVCSVGDGAAVGGWMQGWVVFLDENGNGSFNNGVDIVLRAQESLTGIGDFFAVGAAPAVSAVSDRNHIVYDATGRAIGQQARWLVHAPANVQNEASFTRTLCMNSVGRVRVQTGEVACN